MQEDQNYLEFDRVTKTFGSVQVVQQPFNLSIRRNEFVVFLGPSGCGKTTLMRMWVGLTTHLAVQFAWMEDPWAHPIGGVEWCSSLTRPFRG